MAIILAKAIPAKLFDVQAIHDELIKTSNSEGKHVRSLMNITTNTWREPPTFEVKTVEAANSITTMIFPQGTDKRSWKWVWLEQGTHVRWAVMSGDWISKTKVGRLKGGAGRGRVVLRGKKWMKHPMKGIEARNWRRIIIQMRSRPFREAVDRAIARGIKNKKAST